MAMHTHQEIEIFSRLFQPENANLTADASRSLLAVEFTEVDQQRMHELADKAQQGCLSEREQDEADSYSFVGNVLGILKSKARRSLDKTSGIPSSTDE
ncbi:MAG: hypothetical protein IID44_18950 [Planctomycetes bacterium]|nr:hypothetical protein [Planctomycetota bacterium]